MKKLFPIALCLLIGCGVLVKDLFNINRNDVMAFEGFIAYVFNADDSKEKEPQPIKCNCDKNHKVLSGDGILRVPCPCGNNCKCHKDDSGIIGPKDCDEVKPINLVRDRQVVCITHPLSCAPCAQTERDVFPKLRGMSPPWIISDKQEAFIRTVISDNESNDKYNVKAIPTYILFVDGVESLRHEGYMNHVRLSNFYYGKYKLNENSN